MITNGGGGGGGIFKIIELGEKYWMLGGGFCFLVNGEGERAKGRDIAGER